MAALKIMRIAIAYSVLNMCQILPKPAPKLAVVAVLAMLAVLPVPAGFARPAGPAGPARLVVPSGPAGPARLARPAGPSRPSRPAGPASRFRFCYFSKSLGAVLDNRGSFGGRLEAILGATSGTYNYPGDVPNHMQLLVPQLRVSSSLELPLGPRNV